MIRAVASVVGGLCLVTGLPLVKIGNWLLRQGRR